VPTRRSGSLLSQDLAVAAARGGSRDRLQGFEALMSPDDPMRPKRRRRGKLSNDSQYFFFNSDRLMHEDVYTFKNPRGCDVSHLEQKRKKKQNFSEP